MRKTTLKNAKAAAAGHEAADPARDQRGPQSTVAKAPRTTGWIPTTWRARSAIARSTSSSTTASGRSSSRSKRRSKRIEDGSYGICESCEAEIAPARLEADAVQPSLRELPGRAREGSQAAAAFRRRTRSTADWPRPTWTKRTRKEHCEMGPAPVSPIFVTAREETCTLPQILPRKPRAAPPRSPADLSRGG
mgnify:CR=1 FL=1